MGRHRITDSLPYLTCKEKEVGSLLLQGLNSNEIGKKLFISHKTVDQHLTSVYRKLGVRSRFELLIACAVELKPLDAVLHEKNAKI